MTIEQQTTIAWKIWGHAYALFTRCSRCGEMKQCRGKNRGRMLCIDCWDQQ